MGALTNPAPAGAGAAGTPVLYGPYTVDYTDIPHDGDSVTLWTPAVGDVLLRLFPDPATVVQWDTGTLFIGQDYDSGSEANIIAVAGHGNIGGPVLLPAGLDSVGDAITGSGTDSAGNERTTTAWVFHNDHAVAATCRLGLDAPPSQGHVALYALVARAVAP